MAIISQDNTNQQQKRNSEACQTEHDHKNFDNNHDDAGYIFSDVKISDGWKEESQDCR